MIKFFYIGKDWKEYSKDFILRTDAVWEKDEMKNWFRSYMKVKKLSKK